MQTLTDFVKKYNFKLELEQIASRPDGMMGDMNARSRHYECIITHDADELGLGHNLGDSHTVYFSCGSACDEPAIEDVLSCLASDASGIENNDNFEDWPGEYGYDDDSRKAECVYKACVDSHFNLKSSMYDAIYKELLWDTESN